jgi:hypothetical protein
MFLCDALCNLRGRLQRSRISGFTLSYTQTLLCALFAAGDEDPNYKEPEDYPWPPLPPGSVIIPTPKIVSEFQFGLESSNGRSFVEEMEDEKQDDETLMDEPGNHELSQTSAYATGHGNEALATDDSTRTPRNNGIIPGRVPPYQEDMPWVTESNLSANGNPAPFISDSHFISRSCFVDYGLSRSSPFDHNYPMSTPRKHSRPNAESKSPNTMNRLNEQDPAFLRTINALRSVDNQYSTPTEIMRPKSVLNSRKPRSESKPSDRCPPSLELRRSSESTDKKYSSFLDKLKGMFSI